jgi:phosphoribosyl 1,2-cyclic phosphate phosphodiesterase
MKIQFLGTAASEGFPDAFCDCDNCTGARKLGGPSLRKRSAALIDGILLVDLGPDLMASALAHELSLAKIEYCIQTHEHEDHLEPRNLTWRSTYCGVYGNPMLHYYATEGALAKLTADLGRRGAGGLAEGSETAVALNVTAHVVAPFQSYQLGPYRVSTVKGNHDPEHIVPLLYLIERDGRTLFYATDTGELPEETWQALQGRKIDVVAMDHTFGFQKRSTGHMNAEQFQEQLARMHADGLLNPGARVFAHHVAHHSHPPHPELSAYAETKGYQVAYDGLVVDV